MLMEMADNFYGWAAFGGFVLGALGMFLLAVLFASLALRGLWRWLTRGSWQGVILSAEREAFRKL